PTAIPETTVVSANDARQRLAAPRGQPYSRHTRASYGPRCASPRPIKTAPFVGSSLRNSTDVLLASAQILLISQQESEAVMIYKIRARVFTCLLMCVFGCVGEKRYFPTRKATVEHFQQHEALFQEAMERWGVVNQSGEFGLHRWDDNTFYWNDTIIRPK